MWASSGVQLDRVVSPTSVCQEFGAFSKKYKVRGGMLCASAGRTLLQSQVARVVGARPIIVMAGLDPAIPLRKALRS
jgi:hypothetical protein